MYCLSQTWTKGGGMEHRISAEFPPNLAHHRFASQHATFSLHYDGRYLENGAIRDPSGGRRGRMCISACSPSPTLWIASLLHYWRNASRAFASITFLFFSCSFHCRSASHKLHFIAIASFLHFASSRAASLRCCLNSIVSTYCVLVKRMLYE